jgi:hypothetical protein
MRKTAMLTLALASLLLACPGNVLGEGYEASEKGYEPVETLDMFYEQANAPAVAVQVNGGGAYLFLPSGAEGGTLTVGGEAVPCDLTAGEHTVTDAQGEPLDLTVMRGDGLRSVYITSEDAENAGRAFVEANDAHSTSVRAELTIQDAQATPPTMAPSASCAAGVTPPGTGAQETLPAQTRGEEKADLLGNGHAHKTFLLLADASTRRFCTTPSAWTSPPGSGCPRRRSSRSTCITTGSTAARTCCARRSRCAGGLLDIVDYDELIERTLTRTG